MENEMVGNKTSPHYIAYIDVLGYSEYLKNEDADEYALFKAVKSLMATVTNVVTDESFKTDGFKSRTFSDNVLIAVEAHKGADELARFRELAVITGLLQHTFLRQHGLFLRGGIVYGDLYLDEDLVFGKGLIDVTEVEKGAQYPRIIIDESVIKRVGDQVTTLRFVSKDDDKNTYIDWLQFAEKGASDHVDSVSEAEDLRIVKERLEFRIRKYCWFQGNISDPTTIANRERIITKHLWMIEKYNAHCQKNGYEDLLIQYESRLNRRLMKYELKLPRDLRHKSK